MYDLPNYNIEDKTKIWDFINQYPFAFLSGSFHDGNQVATQLPLLIEKRQDDWFLTGHIMKNTDHYKAFKENPKVLSIFSGAHAYVSATWYTNKNIASTWNYSSIHSHGDIQFVDENRLIDIMKKLTLRYEKDNLESPTIFDNLPDSFLKRTMHAIAGFEIKVEGLKTVFKLSQDKDAISVKNVIKELEQLDCNSKQVAKDMKDVLRG